MDKKRVNGPEFTISIEEINKYENNKSSKDIRSICNNF